MLDIPTQGSQGPTSQFGDTDALRAHARNAAQHTKQFAGPGSAHSALLAAPAVLGARGSAAAKMIKTLKGAKLAHDQQYKGLRAEIEDPHTFLNTAEDVSNLPFHIWAGGAAAGLGLGVAGKVPGVGAPFRHAKHVANAVSGAMNTRVGELHQLPRYFFNHWMYGKPETVAGDYANAKKGLIGEGMNGRTAKWVGRQARAAEAMSEKFVAQYGEKAAGETGQTLFKGAGKFADGLGYLLNLPASPVAQWYEGGVRNQIGRAQTTLEGVERLFKNATTQEGKAIGEEITKRTKEIKGLIHSGRAGGQKGYLKSAAEGHNTKVVKHVQEKMNALYDYMSESLGRNLKQPKAAEAAAGASQAMVPDVGKAVKDVKETATGTVNSVRNFLGLGASAESNLSRAEQRAIARANQLVGRAETSLAKSIRNHGVASGLRDVGSAIKKIPNWIGKMSLHEASFLGMIGFGSAVKIHNYAHHRHHRAEMIDQLRSDMGAAGIDPYNSDVAKRASNAKTNKNWIEAGTTAGALGMDAFFLSMMGGHQNAAAKETASTVKSLVPRGAGKSTIGMIGAMAGIAGLMGLNQIFGNSQPPALESYTEMKAMETSGEKPTVEAYAMLLSAFSPKMAEYGMKSHIVAGLAQQYHDEGKKAIEVIGEIDKQHPFDQRVADVEKQLQAQDVAAHKARKAQQKPTAPAQSNSWAQRVAPERAAAPKPATQPVAVNRNEAPKTAVVQNAELDGRVQDAAAIAMG